MNKKILIIDDEKNIRTTLKHCFKEEQYVVELAENGEEGLNKIKNENFDLVLLDVQMPGLTGFQVLEKIRENHNKVNVIIMTAYGTIEKAVEAMKLGAIDFISKPFAPEEIRNIIKDVFDRENLKEGQLESFKDLIEYGKKCIIDAEYEKAESFLKSAIAKKIESPEPYNLLGVLAESFNDIPRAQRYYRGALAFDPSYVPAQTNLQRTAQIKYTKVGINLGEDK